MIVHVTAKHISGTIDAITSKSHAHRHLICAALSNTKVIIDTLDISSDIEATIKCLNTLGADTKMTDNKVYITPIQNINKNSLLDCNESGSTFRFLLPLSCALNSQSSFIMKESLAKRPITALRTALIQNGCSLSPEGDIPFNVKGQLGSGHFILPGDVSSQYISGLLFALPLIDGQSTIELTSPLQSSGYIDMTLDVLKQYGIEISSLPNGYAIKGNQKYISNKNMTIEKDWSNAAFFLVAGALSEQPITIKGLNMQSCQKDKEIIDILVRMGANVYIHENGITISKKELIATDIDASDIPDLVPVISLLASVAKGTTKIYNAKRLRIKESDRLKSTAHILNSLGADVRQESDSLTISGKPSLEGGTISSFNDHRIAMTGATASLVTRNEVIITDAQAINKSYPGFFEDFEKLGAKIETEK